MKTEKFQTAVVVIAAMLIGSGMTYYLVSRPVQQVVAIPPPAESPRKEQSAVRRFADENDSALDAAIDAAKAQRAAGTLKAIAGTPDEFARALGGINFRLSDFSARFEETPASDAPEYKAYAAELNQLTLDLANLLSDDALIESLDDSTSKALAHHQSLLTAGALALDDVVTSKVEAIIAAAAEKALPSDIGDRAMTAAEEAEFDKKFEAMTVEIREKIIPLLTVEQAKRLDAMGLEQVLFGLSVE